MILYAEIVPGHPTLQNASRECLTFNADLNVSLRRISGVAEGCFSNDAEKLAGRLLAELQFGTAAEIFDAGLHTYIDVLQTRLNDIGAALFQAYIFQPFLAPDIDQLHQQEEQQQQQQAAGAAVTSDV